MYQSVEKLTREVKADTENSTEVLSQKFDKLDEKMNSLESKIGKLEKSAGEVEALKTEQGAMRPPLGRRLSGMWGVCGSPALPAKEAQGWGASCCVPVGHAPTGARLRGRRRLDAAFSDSAGQSPWTGHAAGPMGIAGPVRAGFTLLGRPLVAGGDITAQCAAKPAPDYTALGSGVLGSGAPALTRQLGLRHGTSKLSAALGSTALLNYLRYHKRHTNQSKERRKLHKFLLSASPLKGNPQTTL
ncbi:Hypothetical predicted protein [Podarcis lilfordi]|uniref:Uncharacterized protein n=1 Tax=Podarcis lilfordi TaxID=74358 RepID=A0AA35KLT6_9SAUR|nr:Hypothetical predicted protein [Podarcis lilfordi]